MRHDDSANDKTGQSGVRGRKLAGKSKATMRRRENESKAKRVTRATWLNGTRHFLLSGGGSTCMSKSERFTI